MSDFVDYYEILQVSPKADPEVVEKAYKALIFKHHPDRGGDEETAKRITGAYYVLSNAERRAAYDRERMSRMGSAPSPSAVPHSVRIDEIPPEVIDAILARDWVDGAAATVRTAGRVAGAVAVAGVKVAAAGAGAAYGAYAEHRDEKWRVRSRAEDAERERQAAWERTLAAERAAASWTPAISKRGMAAYESLLKPRTNKSPSPESSLRASGLSPEELVWLSVRHPDTTVHNAALALAVEAHVGCDLLVGQVDEYTDPVVLTVISSAEKAKGTAKGANSPGISTARLVSRADYESWMRDTKSRRTRRAVVMTAFGVAAASLLGWSAFANGVRI